MTNYAIGLHLPQDFEILDVKVRITQTALKDAAYRGLDEDDLAVLVVLLLHDPGAGRAVAGGFHRLEWRDCVVKYRLHDASETLLIVQLMRILPKERLPRDVSGLVSLGREILVDLVKARVRKLLED